MATITPVDRPLNAEPAPTFATPADIALAELLRRRLEQRYLGGVPDESFDTDVDATETRRAA